MPACSRNVWRSSSEAFALHRVLGGGGHLLRLGGLPSEIVDLFRLCRDAPLQAFIAPGKSLLGLIQFALGLHHVVEVVAKDPDRICLHNP